MDTKTGEIISEVELNKRLDQGRDLSEFVPLM